MKIQNLREPKRYESKKAITYDVNGCPTLIHFYSEANFTGSIVFSWVQTWDSYGNETSWTLDYSHVTS